MSRSSIFILVSGVLFLSVVGIVMLMSTCVFSAQADHEDIYREARRQAFWLALGFAACWITSLVDYRIWKRCAWLILLGSGALLVLCYVPGAGMLVNGERRWISVGPVQFQPSEVAKLSIVFFLAFWYARFPDSGRQFFRGLLAPLSIAGLAMALILFEVDIGSTAVLTMSVLVILYVAGVRFRYLVTLIVLGGCGFAAMMAYSPDRIVRLAAFVNPEKHRLDAGFQQWISLMAHGSGGLTGRGIGEGLLKMLYMPFAHTDFIFPMIGEELGFLGAMAVIFAFMCIVCSGMKIACRAPDRFGLLTGAGICSLLAAQAFINIGVTTSMLPNTGLPLPFISYGGSSLVVSFASIGILINIYRQGRGFPAQESSDWGIARDRELLRV